MRAPDEVRGSLDNTDEDGRPPRSRRRDGRLRVHGRGPLPGLAHRAARSSTCRCSPGPRRAVRPRRGGGDRGGGEARLGGRRDRLAGAARAATTCSSSTSARPATRTPRSRSPRWTRASTCSARSRWPTPSPRRERWSRRPSGPRRRGVRSDGRLQLPPGAGGRARPPAGGARAGSARSGTCARSTCRTGSSTPSSRWSGGCEKDAGGVRGARRHRRAHRRHGAVLTGSDLLTGVSALTETFVKERPLPAASAGSAASAAHGGGERSTVDDAALFLGRFAGGALASFEATRFATGRKNAHAHRDQRVAAAAGVRLRGR